MGNVRNCIRQMDLFILQISPLVHQKRHNLEKICLQNRQFPFFHALDFHRFITRKNAVKIIIQRRQVFVPLHPLENLYSDENRPQPKQH